ncbi:MAG: SEC-C metal-binding domain-containing protein, partial [Gemmatimonadota bacterium]
MSTDTPGRNDPCPCGSGRKYKACCLRADREAGLDSHGVHLTPELIGVALASDTWQAELVPLPIGFDDDPEARPAASLVVAGPVVTSVRVHRRPRGEPELVAAILADAVLGVCGRLGAAPWRLEVRHRDVALALQDRLRERGIVVVTKPRLDELDDAATELVRGMTDGAVGLHPFLSSPDTWSGWAVPDEVVAELFGATAAYHEARPWTTFDDNARLEIETAAGRTWSLSVMGAGGISRGLALYSDAADRERLFRSPAGDPSAAAAFRGRCLAITLDHADELPSAMRREVMRHGWPVAAPDAYPHLTTINTPGGGVSTADLGDLVEALRSLASGAGTLGEAGVQGDAEWSDPRTGAVLRLRGAGRTERAAPGPPVGPGWDVPARTVHRIHLTLEDVDPPVWRRFEVPSDLCLDELHAVVQAVMGWEDYHLYNFEADGIAYGEPDEDGWLDFEDPEIPLEEVAARPGATLRYTYDFGDEWRHELTVEAIEPAGPDRPLIRCLEGGGACPPEDCGGPGGYEDLLEALGDPDAEHAETWRAWAGEDYDPERFDPAEANRRLDVLVHGPPLDAACEERLETLMGLLHDAALEGDLSEDLFDEAAELLDGYARLDPDGFLAGRKDEILVAAGLHAAGMLLDTPWSGPRPTLEQLAERFGVSTASISNRSLALRNTVPRPGPVDRLFDAFQSRMRSRLEGLLAFGVDPRIILDAAGFVPSLGPFVPRDLAFVVELEEREVRTLEASLSRGLDLWREGLGRTDRDPRPLEERLADETALGAAVRHALRDGEVPLAARDAVSRWVLARLPFVTPPGLFHVPTSALLPLARLADRGLLAGRALSGALLLALAAAPGPAEGVDPDEIRPLIRAVGRDADLEPTEKTSLLRDLVESTEWGRDGRAGPSLVEIIASEIDVPDSVRVETLRMISGLDDPAPAGMGAGPAARRRALVLRAGLGAAPQRWIGSLLDAAAGADDDVPALAAAELLEAHGAALPGERVEAVVRRGLAWERAGVRQAFFRAGRSLLGDAVNEWASEDVLAR